MSMDNHKIHNTLKLSDELFWFIDAHNDDDLPDGAWWSVLENAVTFWNKDHGTNLDENDTVHLYLKRKDSITPVFNEGGLRVELE